MNRVKFNKGDNLRALCGSQMGNVGTVKKVVPIPGMETEYHVSFDCKPFDLVLTESKLRKIERNEHITERG